MNCKLVLNQSSQPFHGRLFFQPSPANSELRRPMAAPRKVRSTKRTFVRTTIYLANDILVAEREDGLRLSHADAVQLADLLWENDVTSSEVFMIDWHEDAERAPLSGQKVVIYQRLRLHEQSLEQRSTN